jgi:5-methylcytosine-specific restriction protein A
MPKSRPPREVWMKIRERVWERDGGLCQYPYGKHPVDLKSANIDHIKSGKLADNSLSNLRTLCRQHHVLRADPRHRGMIWRALRDGIISPNWRESVWEDKEDAGGAGSAK